MSDEQKQKRTTKKSRAIEEFVGAISDIAARGVYDMTKSDIVDEVLRSSLVPGTSKSVSDLLGAELANLLENYFSDVCRTASEVLCMPSYHYTSKFWYRRGAKAPQSVEEAREYVVVFGNGRTGRAAGVRFVQKSDEPDPMFLVSVEKRIDVVNAAINTRNKRLTASLNSDSVSITDAGKFQARLPKIEEEQS